MCYSVIMFLHLIYEYITRVARCLILWQFARSHYTCTGKVRLSHFWSHCKRNFWKYFAKCTWRSNVIQKKSKVSPNNQFCMFVFTFFIKIILCSFQFTFIWNCKRQVISFNVSLICLMIGSKYFKKDGSKSGLLRKRSVLRVGHYFPCFVDFTHDNDKK